MKTDKFKIALFIGIFMLFSLMGSYFNHLERKQTRLVLEGIETKQTQILAYLACPPELTRVYYDPAVDAPKEPRTEIPVNEMLIPKKKNRGGMHD